ncbi:MAG TPA: gliding motility-associated C-terminal domain-containing protein, partial [Bacteroidales bacterium]|nr:gliding motility-associated C-terminal domain-containing protein [Bacteroidales bacterium]
IGNIVRDMQIEVYETTNQKPEIDSLIDYCVEAGTEVEFEVVAKDVNFDSIEFEANGGPFAVDNSKAQFSIDNSSVTPGYSKGTFNWKTTCEHVRNQDYTVVFKALDNNPDLRLVDLSNVNIKVIGSAPDMPELSPASNSVTLIWNADPCTEVTGYKIYRKTSPIGYVPDSCVAGVPSSTGYNLIANIPERNNTLFVDDGNGNGLEQGAEYCYMITSIYPDGSESYPSEETCTELIAGMPALLKASVTEDDVSGTIDLRWARPAGLDTLPVTGPFEYRITRVPGVFEDGPEEQFIKTANSLDDTVFIDQDVNTVDPPLAHSYTVALYYENQPLSDTSKLETASSFYPDLTGNDNRITMNMRKDVPWINYDYTIYRQNQATGDFDSIAFTTNETYTDTDLKNGQEYCYRVKSTGWRSIEGKLYENTNMSHINCAIPEDNTPPCTPLLTGESVCDEFFNKLHWNFHSDTCFSDVSEYKMYYYETDSEDAPPADSFFFDNPYDTSYIDIRTEESLTGCYQIFAIDSFQNVSKPSVKLCLDECSNYILPNVFSPNNDGKNDVFIPQRTAYVEKVDFQVFNRWGMLVYQTDNPDIYWDGKIMNTDELVSPGVYYYICEVFEPRLGGIESYTLTGFIYVYSGNENNVTIEK